MYATPQWEDVFEDVDNDDYPVENWFVFLVEECK